MLKPADIANRKLGLPMLDPIISPLQSLNQLTVPTVGNLYCSWDRGAAECDYSVCS